MTEQTPEEYRKAMRYQYSKQGADIGVVGILDELEQAYVERDSLKAQMQEWMEGSAQLQVKLDDAEAVLEDWAGHLRERAEGGSKTEAELREQYGLAPRCERVAVCCGAPYEGGFSRSCAQCHEGSRSYKCKYHGCEWPQRGGECPSAGTGNVTT